MIDRLPYDASLDGYGEEPREPRPERDPDETRDTAIERERQHRADVRAALLYTRCHIEHLHNPRG